jgi:AraC-like DNA-binding protein
MVMQLENLKLQGIAPDHVRTIEKSLESAQVTSDCRLGALLSAMCEEVREGCHSGRLYGEAISLALLAYLSGTYATPRPAEISEKGLSPAQKRCLVDYVRANLAANISVTDLAELVQMSPSHFAHVQGVVCHDALSVRDARAHRGSQGLVRGHELVRNRGRHGLRQWVSRGHVISKWHAMGCEADSGEYVLIHEIEFILLGAAVFSGSKCELPFPFRATRRGP